MRVGAISPSGEQLAPARCLVIHGFFPKASLFVGAAGKTGGYVRQRLLGPTSSTTNRLSEARE